jgi:AraC-like DNA-binding protein
MLLYVTLSTIVIALFLLANNYGKNKHAICVSLFLCIVSLYGLTHYFVLFGQSPFWLAVFYNHFTPLYLLLGPLLLFYVRGVLYDTECISKSDLLHGIPALIQFIGILPYLMSPFNKKIEYANQIIENFNSIIHLNLNLFYTADISFLIRVSGFLIYILYCMYLLKKKIPQIKQQKLVPKKQFALSLLWLWVLVSCSLVITLYLLAMTMLSFTSSPKEAFDSVYWMHLVSGIAFFVMTFALLLMPEILYGMPRKHEAISSLQDKSSQESGPIIELKYEQENPMIELTKRVLNYMENDKPYLDPNFSIATLAINLQVPQHHISYCINAIMKTSFYKLRAKYRVNHAITLLENDTKLLLTMEAIGERSGFTTRSNFYKTFKEIVGQTPLEYSISKKKNNS